MEIDFSVRNPFGPGRMTGPYPVLDRMVLQHQVAYHRDVKAWMVSPHELAAFVLRSPRFSTRMPDWNGRCRGTPASGGC